MLIPEYSSQNHPARRSRMAICGMVASFNSYPLGFLIAHSINFESRAAWSLGTGVPSIALAVAGAVLGVLAYARIRRSDGRLRGSWMSIAAVIIGAFVAAVTSFTVLQNFHLLP